MPGLGRFARGKPQASSDAPPVAVVTNETPLEEEAIAEDEGNWMQFDVPGMDFDNFDVNNDASSFGFPDTSTTFGEDDDEEQGQVVPPPAATPNAAPGLGLSMFKNKANNAIAATQASASIVTTTDNAGDIPNQATSVPKASAAPNFQNSDADSSGSHQDTPMEESRDSSSLVNPTPAGHHDGPSDPQGGNGLGMFVSATRNAPLPVREQTSNQGDDNSVRSGFSLLSRASTPGNVSNNSKMNSTTTGGVENTLQGNPPPNARSPVPNFASPTATGATSAKVLPPLRTSAVPDSSSTRILPLPAKMLPPSVPIHKPPPPLQQGRNQGMTTPFANRIPQGQATPQQQTPRASPVAHNSSHLPRPANLQTPRASPMAQNFSPAPRPENLQTPANNNNLLKKAPPAVTPSPSNNRTSSNTPMGDDDMTTVLPPPRRSPNQGTILPPAPPSPQDPTPDFNELHAKFLSDIRDLEDTQNANADRLLSMESNLAIAYSVLLQDQFQFLHLLEKLEDITQETDQVIAKYQQAA